MAPMVKIRTVPTARRVVPIRGESILRRPICATHTRRYATSAAAIREPEVSYPGAVPPMPVPQRKSDLEKRIAAVKAAKPFSDFLTDTFNRQHDYLRISITERCNLRCLYCMPEEGIPLSPPAHMLTTPEIFYLSSLFVSQGVTKIRLTGGEPTVRRDIVPLMQQIGSLRPKGLRELALTTNGISLHRKLDAMVEAGLTGINLSLDTLDPFQFQIMTRRNGFEAVMKSINKLLEMNKLGAGVKLKVNCVVMRGLNEREIIPFVEMGREKDIEVRFIEYMPFGGNKWSQGKMISFQEMLDVIRVKYPDLRRVPGHKNDTSKTFEVPGFVGKVGFITSMTNDFCGTCNRLRITSDGNLKVCLHGNAEVSLRDVLRQGNNGEPIDQEAFERIKQIEMDRHEGRLSEETILGWEQRERELLDVIRTAVKAKAEKHADMGDLENMTNRPMILIDDIRRSEFMQSPPRSLFVQSKPLLTAWSSSRAYSARAEQLRLYSTQSGGRSEYDPEVTPSATQESRDTEVASKGPYDFRIKREWYYDRKVPKATRTYHLRGNRERQNSQSWLHWLQDKRKKGLERPASKYDNLSKEESNAARLKYEATKRAKAKSMVLEDILDEAVEQHHDASGASRQPHGRHNDRPDHTKDTENWSARSFKSGRSPTSSSLVRYHSVYRPGETADSLPPLDGSEKVRTRKPRPDQVAAVVNVDIKSSEARKPSDNLYFAIPDSGEYYIDMDLTIDFDAVTPQLTQYIQQMQDRVKNQYPRMDELPYEVWSTRNRKTLLNWLRILIIRWHVKRQEFSNHKMKNDVTDQLKLVLNEMVREHDLDNEAAERMAKRFNELVRKKPHKVTRDEVDEHELNWMEPGMDFLQDQLDEPEPDDPLNHDTKSTNFATADITQFGVVAKRMYSTSSRPPVDQNNPQYSSQTSPTHHSRTNKPASTLSQESKLPHLTPTGSAHMVSVSAKPHTVRTAIAVGAVYFSNDVPLSLIQSNSIKKGDVLSVSRIAGITAAKKCPDIIPLCHPIALTHVGVELRTFAPAAPTATHHAASTSTLSQDNMSFGGVQIEAKVECTGPTGVEMEALTSVMGTALSVVDMCKAVDKFQRIGDVRVVLKEGGKSGIWREEGWRSWQ